MGTIYDNIAKLANEKGISIYKIEQEAGLGNGVIGRWRESSPNIDTLKKVADVLEVPIEELL